MKQLSLYNLIFIYFVIVVFYGCSKHQEMLDSAQSYFANGNYKQAIQLCQQIINDDPSAKTLKQTNDLMMQSYAGIAYINVLKQLKQDKQGALIRLGELRIKYDVTIYRVKFDSLIDITKSYLIENDPSFMIKSAYDYASQKDFEKSFNLLNLVTTKFENTEWCEKAKSQMPFIKKKQLEYEIELVNNSINSANEEIAIAKEYLNENKAINLTAFMVSVMQGNIYEIALPKWTYYGPLPTENHAILITTETQFTSKGKFTMIVYKTQSIPITLKEDYGGFTQNWTIYKEVDSFTKATLTQKKKLITDNQSNIRKLQKQLDELNYALSKM